MFSFFGGLPRLIVPDNLKSGVNKASFYDPEINRSYGKMTAHYGVGVLSARPRRRKDKGKVEAGVRFAQTYILGRLRNQQFFSLAEANAAIAGMVIITSQVPVESWYEIIGDPTMADAILDRLVHNAYRIELKGDSLRKKRNPAAADAST